MCHILNYTQNKELKEKIDKYLSNQFYGKKPAHMRKTIKHESTCDIALIMFYENRKSLIFNVLGVVVYCFIEKYVCVDYLSLQREAKLMLLHRGFEDTSFDELLRIRIP